MTDFSLLVLTNIRTTLVWSIDRVDRIYQFPFFMMFTFPSFILPQVIADSLTKVFHVPTGSNLRRDSS
jgi:hypothetical protein